MDGVNVDTFFPADDSERGSLAGRRASLGIPQGRRIIVYLGLLADYQGTDALLEAAALALEKRADLHFLIMGFPAVEYYQYRASQLGIADHVTFTGKIAYNDARDYLALGDIAVAPKLSLTEASGKILNYMAMGLPTVAFDTRVSREYLGDAGFYAKQGDPVSLAEALLGCLSDPETALRRQTLRSMARNSYSWSCTAEAILLAYGAVCRRSADVL
jgi:glycosyltransferase involved in cell wall biosynthesis